MHSFDFWKNKYTLYKGTEGVVAMFILDLQSQNPPNIFNYLPKITIT